MKAAAMLLCLVLAACGGGGDDECPAVTPENVHLMTGDVPPGSPCAQVLRETAPNVHNEAHPIDW